MRYLPEENRFYLGAGYAGEIKRLKGTFGFGVLGEVVFYRTYSRLKKDGTFENWNDTVLRVIEGVCSIRKDHCLENGLEWDEAYWQEEAFKMAKSLFFMEWMPAGRGLWAMGTEYVYEKGSMALNNCGACDTADLSRAVAWTMDALMCGVGVGFNTAWEGAASKPDKSAAHHFVIPDSKEGWAASLVLLIDAYTKNGKWPLFDYSKIRPCGAPIKGFGGKASGPGPLKKLHERVETYLDDYCDGKTHKSRCIVDIFNAIGACIAAGNVRRSAELALGRIDDDAFLELKDYEKHPERETIGWMSNNSVAIETQDDMRQLPKLAEYIRKNGEPGILNLANVQRYARLGEESPDKATLTNPCGEIPLESFELCNLAEAFPHLCKDEARFFNALRYATFYTSTVALMPTQCQETNAVISRNRRIGVGVGGIAQYLEEVGPETFRRLLERGYDLVKAYNAKLAEDACVNPSVRLTTVKPSGTISQLCGVTPGIHYPAFRYALRRIRIADSSDICSVLKEAGIPHEQDTYSDNTTVFEFPVESAVAKTARQVSAWQQFELLVMLQKEWADNMISCSVYFDPETEGPQLGKMLKQFVPKIKSVSLFPFVQKGIYTQMPYEGITKDEYECRLAAMRNIDFSRLHGNGLEETEHGCTVC